MKHIAKNKKGLAPCQKSKQVGGGSCGFFSEVRIFSAGFTLIEIMIAIGIVGILAAVVLVSMTSFRTKARSAKALAQLSSAIPGMVSCWGNGGTVSSPSGGTDICNLASSYGKWPQTAGDLSSYSYSGAITNRTDWHVTLTDETDNQRICCNSTMNNCKLLDTASSACSSSNPSY